MSFFVHFMIFHLGGSAKCEPPSKTATLQRGGLLDNIAVFQFFTDKQGIRSTMITFVRTCAMQYAYVVQGVSGAQFGESLWLLGHCCSYLLTDPVRDLTSEKQYIFPLQLPRRTNLHPSLGNNRLGRCRRKVRSITSSSTTASGSATWESWGSPSTPSSSTPTSTRRSGKTSKL